MGTSCEPPFIPSRGIHNRPWLCFARLIEEFVKATALPWTHVFESVTAQMKTIGTLSLIPQFSECTNGRPAIARECNG